MFGIEIRNQQEKTLIDGNVKNFYIAARGVINNASQLQYNIVPAFSGDYAVAFRPSNSTVELTLITDKYFYTSGTTSIEYLILKPMEEIALDSYGFAVYSEDSALVFSGDREYFQVDGFYETQSSTLFNGSITVNPPPVPFGKRFVIIDTMSTLALILTNAPFRARIISACARFVSDTSITFTGRHIGDIGPQNTITREGTVKLLTGYAR